MTLDELLSLYHDDDLSTDDLLDDPWLDCKDTTFDEEEEE